MIPDPACRENASASAKQLEAAKHRPQANDGDQRDHGHAHGLRRDVHVRLPMGQVGPQPQTVYHIVGNYVYLVDTNIGRFMVRTRYCAAVLLACMAISSPSAAEQAPNDQGMYAGIFGGLGAATATSLQQRGAV